MSILKKYYKTYLEYNELVEVESKKDPPTEPFRSMYKARDILLKDVESITKDAEQIDSSHPDHEFCRNYLSLLLLQIGNIYVDTEDLSQGVNYLNKAIDSIQDPLHPLIVFVSVEARNNLGYGLLRLSKPEEATKILEESENIYKDFRKIIPPRTAGHVFESLEGSLVLGEDQLEVAHTMTKFYLAQAYGVLKDSFKSSVYCHETLRRQLIQKKYDPVDWALNSATLSQFFMEKFLFKQGRHHLAAASHILDEYGDSIKKMEGSREEIEAKTEEFRHRSADVSWCWAKYGFFILQHSRYKLSNRDDPATDEKHEGLENMFFEGIDVTRYENEVTDADVVAFEDAREVFLFSQRHFNKAKEYYTLEDRASEHVQIVRDHSHLFNQLSGFEPDEERQFKMLKKRADMLEVVLKELNPRFYMDKCRQLWFELGEIYHDMMQIKYRKVDGSKDVPTPQALKKINSLIESSVKNFNHFLDSVKDVKTNRFPDPLEEDLLVPVLTAYFYLGRLYFKYITPDRRVQAENTTKAYESFKYLVDSCDKSEKAKAAVDEKYQISKELMTLLQMKILQL